MDANITRDVIDLVDNDRSALEHLLGAELSEAQKVYIMVFTPGKEPDAPTQQDAAKRIEQVLDQAATHAQAQHVGDTDIDEAVDDAMEEIRRRGT